MTFRYKFSIILAVLGFMVMVLSLGGGLQKSPSPEKILQTLESGEYKLSADELAASIVDEDSSMQIIDLRNQDLYGLSSLPGAINVPFHDILTEANAAWFSDNSTRKILYASDSSLPELAFVLLSQKNFQNLYVLQGGMTAWNSLIMHSEFTGKQISPRENALFEKRFKARRLYNQWNAMPDSLKASFFADKKKKDKELVGGC
ncbi:MAG: hypothetical protein H6539_08340 [Bacteroidales bacterium]|nr:hypothetical protein [Bacteroidales bacterium]